MTLNHPQDRSKHLLAHTWENTTHSLQKQAGVGAFELTSALVSSPNLGKQHEKGLSLFQVSAIYEAGVKMGL